MKKMTYLLIALITFVSCNNDEDTSIVDENIVSIWKLTAQLADPGDGSGTFTPVNSEKLVVFYNDGTITSNGDLCFMEVIPSTPTSGTYTSENQIIIEDCTSPFQISFVYENNNLIIYYPCIEPCAEKYELIQ